MSPGADQPKAAPAPAAEVPAAEDTTLQRMVRCRVRVVMMVRVKFLKDQGDLKS